MIDTALDFLGEVIAAAVVFMERPSWPEKRKNRKYQTREGDMVTRFKKRWSKPFPTKTYRNGAWEENK